MDQGQKKSGVLLTIALCSTKGPLGVNNYPLFVYFFNKEQEILWKKLELEKKIKFQNPIFFFDIKKKSP